MKAGFCAHVDATQNRLFYIFFFFRCYYQQQQTVLHLPLFLRQVCWALLFCTIFGRGNLHEINESYTQER